MTNEELETKLLSSWEETLALGRLSDYPNASKEYKKSSFVVGAQDMLMVTWKRLCLSDFDHRVAFARKVNAIRNAYLK